jgi:hypothetical protein
MMKFNSYFKNEKLAKIIMGVLLVVMILLVAGVAVVKAEDNKTIEFDDKGWPKILDDDEWRSQLVFDTTQACYQGTIRWVLLSNPSLFGQLPSLIAQRQMMEHCFCVMDKIRKEVKLEDYKKKVLNPLWAGNMFMENAAECVKEYETLPSFFMKMPIPDNATKTDNGTVEKLEVLPAVPEGPEESSPDEKLNNQQTILQG